MEQLESRIPVIYKIKKKNNFETKIKFYKVNFNFLIQNAPGSSSWVTETASQMSVDSMPKQHTSSGIIRAHSNVVPKIDLPKPRSGCKSAPK